ncbi:MAG: RtcB family protein [Nanoarchaeota archaeon]|nr:RtcB family protein [Nanoarchaeota archaeon]
MTYKEQLKKINENTYELPKTGKMLVPGRLFLSKRLLELVEEDALKQVVNVAMLPGILKYSIGLSDMHTGYGFCIGGVAAFDLDSGIISPGGVGYDIDCSVRLLKTNLKFEDIKNKKELIHSLFRAVPSGVGRGSNVKLNWQELDEVLKKGAKWAVEKGYGIKEDLEHLEENGCLNPCNPDDVSKRAKQRGIGQLGTLGAGNHFLEIQKVDEIFDSATAKRLGLEKNQVTIMIHCGSRGLGHQVASDYIKLMEDKYGWPEFDRELVNAPIKSELGKKYFSAMNCAANFAFANKQIITHWVRENLKHYFPDIKVDTVYEVCHNIAKIEKHIIDGKEKEILVMRKGATRSFPNQPVLIPGSMGTASYVLIGTEKAGELSFFSTAHGAGRVASRTSARKSVRGEDVKKQLNEKGIDVEAGSWKGLSEEAPQMYKDIDEVVKVSHDVGIGKLVAKLVPVAVMKG